MGRQVRTGGALIALLAAAALLVLGPSTATAAGGGAAATIKLSAFEDGFYGYVKSPLKTRCADKRRIQIFVTTSGNGGGRKVDAVSAHRTGGKRSKVMFGSRVKSGSKGDAYAIAKRKPGCAKASSNVISNGPKAVQSFPACPKMDGGICRLDEIDFDTGLCPNFLTSFGGDCDGTMDGARAWENPQAELSWSTYGLPGDARRTHMRGKRQSSLFNSWELTGIIPGGSRPEWAIDDGWNNAAPGVRFRTGGGGPTDVPGGPLNFYFNNGIIGADVYIHGYLMEKG